MTNFNENNSARATVEVRWFFKERPFEADQFFNEDIAPASRTDWYSFPCDRRSGVKVREGRLEAKLFVASLGVRRIGAVVGQLERWTKWGVQFPPGQMPADSELSNAGWVPVEKKRHLQSFTRSDSSMIKVDHRPTSGCEFELTELNARHQQWWTVGFEAVGDEAELQDNLRLGVETVFGDQPFLTLFRQAASYGYPAWLWQLESELAGT